MSKFFIAKTYNANGNEVGCGPAKGKTPSTLDDALSWATKQLQGNHAADHVVVFEAIRKLERVQPVVNIKETTLMFETKALEAAE